MNLRDASIGKRLMVSFGTIILICLISSAFNDHSIRTATTVAHQVTGQYFPYALLAEEMAFDVEAVQQFLTDVSATRDPEGFTDAEHAAKSFAEGIGKFKQMYQENNDLDSVKKLEVIETDFNEYYAQGQLMAKTYLNEGTDAGNKVMHDFDKKSVVIAGEIREFKKLQTREANTVLQELTTSLARTRALLWFLATCTFILGIMVSLLITRSIARPIVEAVTFAQSVAQGDLTNTITVTGGGKEIRDLTTTLNSMVARLREMVSEIRGTSAQVASAASEISASSEQLAQSSQIQASSAEETSSTMVEMAASIQNVSGSTISLASSVDEISSSITQLGSSSEQMAKSSEVMASAVSKTSDNIEQMTVSIEHVARNAEDLASSVSETSSTVEQMTVSIEQVARNSQELQDVVSETASIVEEMAVSIKQVAKNVEEADGVAKQAAKEGSAGQRAVNDALSAMKRVAEVTEKTADSILNLGRRSEEIGSIVKVIDDIADQTNLLALNAAIEAARAGDAGRGFAVVADEVRKLAERSMSATSEIAQVIKEVQADTTNSVKYGELASREAKSSIDLSLMAGEALENIVKNVKQTSTLMSQIAIMAAEQASASGQVINAVERMSLSSSVVANAAREQALGGRQIRIAIDRMNMVTKEVTSAAREQATGSKEIRLAVANMNQVTHQVNVATREQAISARQIVLAATGMNNMTQSVANATMEQKKGGDLVVKAVENISDLTRESLCSVEQLSQSAQTLSMEAEKLANLVAAFKV